MNKMKPSIIDLFCGIGGLSLGFDMAGFDTVLSVDVWKDAIETFNHNRTNKVARIMDVCKLNKDSIKELTGIDEVDGIIGGPPCQGFSTVGTRQSDDPRNHLYLEFCRIVEEMKPKFFVIENVKGLLTLSDGFFKKDIEKRFGAIGYKISAKVLDVADFGVPQNRKRVFFIGSLNGIFSFPDSLGYKVSAFEALSDLPSLDGRDFYPDVFKYEENKFLTPYQKIMRNHPVGIYNHNYTFHSEQTISVISKIKDGGKISDLPREYWDIRKYNKSFQRMNSQLPSHTVDTGHRNYFHYAENRVPSVRECCRLQSFRDDFEILGCKTSQYKQVGNAVPPIMAKFIAEAIKSQIVEGISNGLEYDKKATSAGSK